MGGERGDEKGKRKRRERRGEGEGKKGSTVGLKPSQSKISGYVTDAMDSPGASIPMGQGGHVPLIFGLGGIITNAPPNISRAISATFYPYNIFLIS